MSFIPCELSVKEIFGNDKRYKIPNFQREFSWEKKNFNDFFNDLFNSCKYNLENLSIEQSEKYFLGMILILGKKDEIDVEKPYEVIDGQQRLTTITLFFAAILEIIETINMDYKTGFDSFLNQDYFIGGEKKQITKLVNEALNPILPIEILNLNGKRNNGVVLTAESSEQKWLLESFEYIKTVLLSKSNILESFNQKYNQNIKEFEDKDYIKLLDSFGNHLSNATMICIYHDNRLEAHNLFRNMNSRGKGLEQTDLIKNDIYALIEDDSQYASKKWNKIKENVYISNGKLNIFLYHYMYGRYSNVVLGKTYQVFLKNIKKEQSDYMQFVESLENASVYYRTMIMPDENDSLFGVQNYFKTDGHQAIKRQFDFFGKIGITQFRILMLSLFECREKNFIKDKLFCKFINIIAKHQCIHVMVKSSANKLSTIYGSTSKKLLGLSKVEKKDLPEEANKILNEFEENMKSKLPDRNALNDVTLEYKGKKLDDNEDDVKKYALIRFILSTIAEHEQDKGDNRGNDGLGFIHNATIEHIIDKENDDIENVYSIGNLLLLEPDIHKNVKTKEEKIEMYNKSKISITKRFFSDYPEFNMDQIIQRKNSLLSEFYDLVKG